MTQYLRITVIGSRRKADIALPDDIALHELLPEILDLLDEPPASSPLVLTSLIGVQARTDVTLATLEVSNGAVFRLAPADEAPRPPEVAEVTEAVGDATVSRRDRWNPLLTTLASAVALGLAGAVMATLLPVQTNALLGILGALFAAAVIGGAMLGRRRHTRSSASLFGLSVGVSPALASSVVALTPQPLLQAATLGATWSLIWLAAAVVFGIGHRNRGVLIGAAGAWVIAAAAVLSLFAQVPVTVVAAVGGIALAALIGLIPSVALSASGVTGLDDAASADGPVARGDLRGAISAAFATQTALVLAAAAPLAISIALLTHTAGWATGLGLALAAFVLARSRLFPGAVSRIALLLAALVPILMWLATPGAIALEWRVAAAVAVVVVLLAAAFVPQTPAAHARLRRGLGLIETLSLIAVFPCLLGVLGIYADLLGAFA